MCCEARSAKRCFKVADHWIVLTARLYAENPVKFGDDAGTKYKFLAEAPGDKAQIERLFWACKGVEQVWDLILYHEMRCMVDRQGHLGFSK